MEPPDQPPPPPQTWAETSAWAPTQPAAKQGLREDAAVPPAIPLPSDPPSVRPERSPRRWLVLAAVITSLVAIAAGDNQWVTKKTLDYGAPGNGFLRQLVFSTQTLAWRVSKASGESTSQWVASLLGILAVLVATGLLVALLVRRGSFWRAAVGSMLIAVFATQVAVFVDGLISNGSTGAVFHGRYVPLSDVGQQGYTSYLRTYPGGSGGGGGRATRALFDGPTGYTMVGGLILGIIVGLVVGIVARRFGEPEPEYVQRSAPTPQAVPQAFFGPGDMQRTYEASGQGAVAPQLAEPGSVPPKDVGRHARGEDGSY